MRKVVRNGLVLAATLAATATSVVAVSAPAQAALTAACQYSASEPVLKKGSNGAAVKQVQCEYNLSTRGDNLAIDGNFGPATDKAIRRFQQCVGIEVDGSVGPVTWSHLNYWATQSGYPANC